MEMKYPLLLAWGELTTYEGIKLVLELFSYNEHQWIIYVFSFLLGQQSGYTKYPRFVGLWDSKARQEHWVQK